MNFDAGGRNTRCNNLEARWDSRRPLQGDESRGGVSVATLLLDQFPGQGQRLECLETRRITGHLPDPAVLGNDALSPRVHAKATLGQSR